MGYGCTVVFSALGGAGSNYLQGVGVYIQRPSSFHGQKYLYGYHTRLSQSDVLVDRTLIQVQFTAYRPV